MKALTILTPKKADASGDVGMLALRVVVGCFIALQGEQKLFDWFGGGGLDGTAAFFASRGYAPAYPFAVLAGLTELVGGLLLAVGLLTPLASAALVGVMTNAVAVTLTSVGFWSKDGGAEYPIVVAVIAVCVAAIGPGRYSLDRAQPWAAGGARPAVVALVLGVVSAAAVLVFTGPLVGS
ncbi:DoxX family protein [Allokutzneria sp. A3M-2-11 16]|uniref:DoxX family protein n=1 Tax=Allokutzneria sp. A3M-2-11 16 TaxID=2962043 RepID=UPI0020B7D2BC|nr:DoxX family protein [Allokutzneria sp. A3M-2-11 16]MCP3797880.1 DoxX family protein [Allokutzneria sp. A3M-2-11 16]